MGDKAVKRLFLLRSRLALVFSAAPARHRRWVDHVEHAASDRRTGGHRQRGTDDRRRAAHGRLRVLELQSRHRDGLTYSWDFGDAAARPTPDRPRRTYSTPAPTQPKLTAQAARRASVSSPITITANVDPNPITTSVHGRHR